MSENVTVDWQQKCRGFVEAHVIQNQNFILQMAQAYYSSGSNIPNYAPFDEEDLQNVFGQLCYYNVDLTDSDTGKMCEEQILATDISDKIEVAEDMVSDCELAMRDVEESSEYALLATKLERLENNVSALTSAVRRGDTESHEPFECWLVDDWLAGELEEKGEAVLTSNGCRWWFRCTTGQAILLDYVIKKIVKEREKS